MKRGDVALAKPLIETIDLKKYFDVGTRKLHAVDGITISIEEGKTLGVVGESGCGKSTLGRTILKLLEPTDGKIFFEGSEITHLKPKEMRSYRRNMQMIFQDPYSSLNPRQTVASAIGMPLKVHGICASRAEMDKRIGELMDIVGLAKRLTSAYPHELDGGRRQRVGVARALACNPKFIVCDEPVSALDVSIQAQILNLLMDIQDEMGLTYLFVTHDMSVVKHISDEIMVMYMGHCVEKAPYDELFEHPLHPYTQALLSAIPSLDVTKKFRHSEVIRGEVSSPIDPKPGCRFANRCEYVMEECTQTDIPMKELIPHHHVACLYAEQQAAGGSL